MDRCGTPEQVFTPGYVEELFGMTAGKFDAAGGSVEFSVPGGAVKPEDLPENAVFVIAGNGSGRQVFRKLQRENVPFVTGILCENDLDLPAAEALGRICGAPIVGCPPAVPVAVSGERITPEALALFIYYGMNTVEVLEEKPPV